MLAVVEKSLWPICFLCWHVNLVGWMDHRMGLVGINILMRFSRLGRFLHRHFGEILLALELIRQLLVFRFVPGERDASSSMIGTTMVAAPAFSRTMEQIRTVRRPRFLGLRSRILNRVVKVITLLFHSQNAKPRQTSACAVGEKPIWIAAATAVFSSAAFRGSR